tara:strand:+ start:456 stop:614 length:159 start_codon:yes stop_codon:yes gene_type:complete
MDFFTKHYKLSPKQLPSPLTTSQESFVKATLNTNTGAWVKKTVFQLDYGVAI